MSWTDVLDHDDVLTGFQRAVQRDRLASTFLFVGPPGIGKRTFAMKLAQALLCESQGGDSLDPCGVCPSCLQSLAGTHPDLEYLCKPDDKAIIPLELFIGNKEHRNREGLCHRIALKPMRGRRKIAVIDDADSLNAEGANCLLKTLEEPPPRSVIMLIGTSAQRQLPTIRSRCQIVRFRPLSQTTVQQLLIKHGFVESAEEAQRLAELSGGSLDQALELRDADLRDFREHLFRALPQVSEDSVEIARQISQFVEAAGKESPPRRARLQTVARWASEYYRHAMRGSLGEERRAQHAAERLDRCVAVAQQVDANANLASLVESWIDDLAYG